IFASEPGSLPALEETQSDEGSALAAAIDQLDAFPTIMYRDGKPVLQGGYHEEIAGERKIGTNGKVSIAAFHDDSRHTAVFGKGDNLPSGDYFQDVFSNTFAYDGGAMNSWGTRVAYQEKFGNEFTITTVYAFGGALTPEGDGDGTLRESLKTVARHSLGANI